MSLAPIFCNGCGAPLPLAIPQPQVNCPYCSAVNALPQEYVAAAAMRQKESAARAAAEPLWQKLGEKPSEGAELAGGFAVIFLPPLATLLGYFLKRPDVDAATLTAVFTLPAIVPGAGLWLWAAAVKATTSGLRAQLAARPLQGKGGNKGKDALGCRNCGATLSFSEGALSATCGYCGTDSLVQAVPKMQIKAKMQQALRGLDEAVELLRKRRTVLGLGVAGLSVLIAGACGLLWYALIAIG